MDPATEELDFLGYRNEKSITKTLDKDELILFTSKVIKVNLLIENQIYFDILV